MKDIFGMNKLILINTEKSNYIEAALTHEILNFSSRNGIGKTSKIKTLKMLLSPEENFNKSVKKFNIENKSLRNENVDYQNYQFYFKDNKSFIICEHVNNYGVFCQILTKSLIGKNLGISRLFIDKDYNSIKDWFMQENDGVGTATKITNIEVMKKIKENGGIFANEKSIMKSIMFNSYQSYDNGKRFNIIDLKSSEDIGMFCDVLDMILTGMNDETIKNIIIKICENTTDKSKNENMSKLNIKDGILPGFLQIKKNIQDYQFKMNLKDKYLNLKNEIAIYKNYTEEMTRILPESIMVKNKKNETGIILNTLNNNITNILNIIKENNNQKNKLEGVFAESIKNINKNKKSIELEIKEIIQARDSYEKKQKEYNETINLLLKATENSELNIQEIIKNMEDDIIFMESIMQDKDFSKIPLMKKELKNINREIEENLNHLDFYKKQLKDINVDIDRESEDLMNILNTIFIKKFSVSEIEENKEILFKFKNEFLKFELNEIYIGDKKIGTQKEIIRKDINEINDDIEFTENKLIQLNIKKEEFVNKIEKENENKKNLENNEKEYKLKIDLIKKQLKILNSISNEEAVINKLGFEKEKKLLKVLNDLNIETNTISEKYNLDIKTYEYEERINKNKMSELNSLKNENEELIKKLNVYEKDLDEVKRDLTLKREFVEKNEILLDNNTGFDVNFVKNIRRINDDRNDKLKFITNELKSFLENGVLSFIDNEWLNFSESLTFKQINQSCIQLSEIFENLEERYRKQKIEDEKNKDALIESISVIIDMNKIVQSSIKEINSIIEKNVENVSSIESFYLSLETNKIIKELCEKITMWKNESKEQDQFFDINRYDSIIQYLITMTDNIGNEVRYSDIIKNINTIFYQDGQSSASGSKGTNIILNVIFISSVFDKLIQPSTTMQLPIIIDEIGNLDSNNKRLLIYIVKEKDYKLISTTPELDFFDPDFPDIDLFDINLQSLMTRESELTTDIFPGFEDRQTYFYSQRKEIDYIGE